MDHNQLGGGGGGGGGGHQRPPSVAMVQERRRVMEGASQQLQQPQQAPPQLKCPRCQSNNTKFCYYNNYSLSQPRYFCKGCRRYWTHGGTLRNVPVGGCSRKSKRPKIAEPSVSAHQQQQQHQQQHLQAAVDHDKNKQNVVAHLAPIGIGANLGLVSNIGSSSSATTMAPQMLGAHYPGYGGHGFLSSLAVIQAMNHPRPPPYTQALGVAGGGGDMDSPLLRGFALPSFGIQQATTRPSGAGNHQQTWQQGLMGNVNQLSGDPAAGSDPRFWSIGGSSGSGSGANNVNNNDNNGNSHVGSGASQHPNLQWPDHFGGGGGGCGLNDA